MSTLQFTSLGKFAAHLLTLQNSIADEMELGLTQVAQQLTATMLDELLTLQQSSDTDPTTGIPLTTSPATATSASGASSPAASGDSVQVTQALRDSIGSVVTSDTLVIGSDSDTAVDLELGTDTIPPQPFLGPAVIQNEDRIKELLGHALAAGLLGRTEVPSV